MKSFRFLEDVDEPTLVKDWWKGREMWLWDFGPATNPKDGLGRIRIPVVEGAASGDPTLGLNPIAHPLDVPTVTGTSITVDTMLQQPTRVTQFLMDITLQRFVLDRLFDSAGGVTGGAVVYDQIVANDLYTFRDVERVAPGTEFPIVTSGRRAPKVAEVEKYGGKFWFSDEARDRNDQAAFRNESVRLGNTIVRKLNSRAVEVLNAAVAANAGLSQFTGNNWSTAVPTGASPTPPAQTPGADFAKAQLLADQQELGVVYNLALVNPQDLMSLRLFYDSLRGLEPMLEDTNIDEIYASNRIPLHTVDFVEEGSLGEMRLEQPLATETWRDYDNQRTWVQSSVRPVMYVTNPFSVMQATLSG